MVSGQSFNPQRGLSAFSTRGRPPLQKAARDVFQSPTRIIGLFNFAVDERTLLLEWGKTTFQSPTRIIGLFNSWARKWPSITDSNTTFASHQPLPTQNEIFYTP
jgi:hypothetical protein